MATSSALWRSRFLSTAVLGILALTFANQAALGEVSSSLFSIEVSSARGNASWSLNTDHPGVAHFPNKGRWAFSLPPGVANQIVLSDGQTELAKITGLTVDVEEDPTVALGFAVQAIGADTHFSITSALVSFSPLVNPDAFASVEMGTTESASDNGVDVTGGFAGGTVFEARYNGGGSTFASILDGNLLDIAPLGGSTSADARVPSSGFVTIVDSVQNIEAEFDFTLSADDIATGSGRFTVVPEPTTLALFAAGGLAWIRRRRA